MDALYVLGKGSKWGNNELRYSLRSLKKYMKGIERIFICGECPEWIQNVYHIPCRDISPYAEFKEQNIYQKIVRACIEGELSNDFLFINDDHFFLKPAPAAFPFFYDDPIEYIIKHRNNGSTYMITMRNTVEELNKRGCYTRHFDIHTPIIFNKNLFMHVFHDWNWNKAYGYMIKSAYVNSLGITGDQEKDCKINRSLPAKLILDKIQERYVLSIGDSALNMDMKAFLQERFPDKSPWEI